MRIVHLRCGRLWNNVEMAETISTWQHFFHCTELQPPPPPLSTRSETDIVGWKPCQRKAAKSSPQYVLQTCPGSIWTPSSGSVLDRQVVNADLQRNSSFQALSVSYPDVYSPYNLSWRAASAGSILRRCVWLLSGHGRMLVQFVQAEAWKLKLEEWCSRRRPWQRLPDQQPKWEVRSADRVQIEPAPGRTALSTECVWMRMPVVFTFCLSVCLFVLFRSKERNS